MNEKTYDKWGKPLLYFSIAASIFIIYLTLRGGNIEENINNGNWALTLTFIFINIANIFTALKTKDQYPIFNKYSIQSSTIFIITAIIFDLIPRLIL